MDLFPNQDTFGYLYLPRSAAVLRLSRV